MKTNRDPAAKCRVLIADDDQKVRALLSELLEAEDYEVWCTSDGGSAREAVTTFGPEVIISDVVMPVLDGIELCRLLKKDHRTSNIPVLLISGLRNAAEDSLEGLTAGADDYLNVPFRNDELLVKVARLAERHRAHQALRESDCRAQCGKNSLCESSGPTSMGCG
jgi:DNA-binding response OmpR family regulator